MCATASMARCYRSQLRKPSKREQLFRFELMEAKKNYLNGQWVGGGETIEVVNPATEEVIGKISTVTREQVRTALVDAQTAFEGWRSLPAKVRADHLLAVAGELNKRTDEIARLMTQENGKPLAQSK